MVCRVPVEQGNADFHYAEEDGSVELPRVQVTRAELVKLVAQNRLATVRL